MDPTTIPTPGAMPPMDPMQGMMPPPPPAGGDLDALVAMLEQVVGPSQGTSPIYPSGYKKPSKPDEKGIFGKGLVWRDRYANVREEMYDNIQWLNGEICGMFDEDIEKANAGLTVTKWPIQTMIAEWEMICAFGSGLPFSVDKPVFDQRLKAEVNQLKEAVRFLRRVEIDRHAAKGNGYLPMDEWHMLTEYGQIVNRNVINLDDPDFPFDSELIDPATVFPEWGGRNGLNRVWRVYLTTASRLFGDYGEPPKAEMKKLRNEKGNDVDDDTEIEVVEYWDTWHRAVQTNGGTRVVPLKAHEYGYVPFTIQYGPLGQPMGTMGGRSRGSDDRRGRYASSYVTDHALRDDLVHKSVSYIHTMKRAHAQMEALMSRMVTGVKKSINPPVIRERDDIAAEKPLEAVDTGPDGTTEIMLGHERISPVPGMQGGLELSVVMETLAQELSIIRAPISLYGLSGNRSNVSGTAVNAGNAAGLEKINPWVETMEQYHSRRFKQWLGSYRNFGHLVRYRDYTRTGERRPFMVPVAKPRKGDAAAFELTPELIDRAGAWVDVSLQKIRQSDMMPFLQGAQMANQMGVMTLESIAKQMGDTDYDRTSEEWLEETMVKQAVTRPEFAEIFGVPMAIEEEMAEHAGDPELVARYQRMLDKWNQRFVAPAEAQAAAAANPQPQPPQGPPSGDPNAGGLSSTAGIDTSAMGIGPGTQGGQVGRPTTDPNGMPIPASSVRLG